MTYPDTCCLLYCSRAGEGVGGDDADGETSEGDGGSGDDDESDGDDRNSGGSQLERMRLSRQSSSVVQVDSDHRLRCAAGLVQARMQSQTSQ